MHGRKGPAHGCYPLTQPPAQERSLQELAEANQQPQVPLEEVEAKVADGSMDDAAVDKLKAEARSQPQPQPQVPQHDEYDKATLQHLQAGASQPHGTQGVLATKVEALAVPPEVPQAEQQVRPCPASLHTTAHRGLCATVLALSWRRASQLGPDCMLRPVLHCRGWCLSAVVPLGHAGGTMHAALSCAVS